MRKLVIICLLFSLVLSTAGFSAEQPSRLVYAIMVVVNGKKITRTDLNDMAKFLFKRSYPKRPYRNLLAEESEILFDRSMREYIRICLIEDEYKRLDLTIDGKRLEGKYEELGVDRKMAGVVQRRYVASELMFDEIMSKIGFEFINPGPKDVRDFYFKNKTKLFVTQRQVKVRHIMLSTEMGDFELKGKQAKMLRKSILAKDKEKQAAFFAKVAAEFSEGRFRKNGGQFNPSGNPSGWFNQEFINRSMEGSEVFPGAMVTGIRSLTTPGNFPEPVQSDKGFHLLYLEAAKGGVQMSFDKAQKYIYRIFRDRERKRAMSTWLHRKLKKSQVNWHDGAPYPHDKIIPSAKKVEKKKEEKKAKPE